MYNIIRFCLTLFIIILTSPNFSANASNHYKEYLEDSEIRWGFISSDDGFDKTVTVFKTADNYGIDEDGDDITYSIEIQCSKKRLGVIVYGEPDIYPQTRLGFKGSAQMRIDSGTIRKHNYISLRDNSGVQFDVPRNITKAILSSKQNFSFKIPSSIQNDAVATFSKLDFGTYASQFKSLGCAFK